MRLSALAAVIVTGALHAQPPAIFQDGVVNAASRIPGSLAGGGIAPGVRFIVQGARLGNSTLEIRQAGRTFTIKPVAYAKEALEATMPMEVPPGPATLTVRTETEASKPFPINVVLKSFGIYTINGTGWGPARLQNQTKTEATLEGTGPKPALFLAGKSVTILSVIPSTDPGVVRLRFRIPKGAPEGCSVPLYTRTNSGTLGNVTTIAISHGGTCRDEGPWLSPLTGPGNSAVFFLARLKMLLGFENRTTGNIEADFAVAANVNERPSGSLATPFRLLPPPGVCTAYTGHFTPAFSEGGLFGDISRQAERGLNAGDHLTVTGPLGERQIGKRPENGFYHALLGGKALMMGKAAPLFLVPGDYSISNGNSWKVSITRPSDFEWSNAKSLLVIDRKRGFTVAWRGVAPTERLLIAFFNVDQFTTAAGLTVCVPPTKRKVFHVPAEFLSNIPASQNTPGIPVNYLLLAAWNGNQTIPANSSLDAAFSASWLIRGQTVTIR